MSYIGKIPTAAPLTSSDVADGIITNAKLAQDIISADTALGAEPADTDELLISDAGVLKRMDYSYIKGGGITVADQWRLTADNGTDGVITSNLEQVDTTGQGALGSAMTQSSGIFTFPSTGFWWVDFQAVGASDNSSGTWVIAIDVTTNNSSYAEIAYSGVGSSDGRLLNARATSQIDVTDVANVKVRFDLSSFSGDDTLYGNSAKNQTTFTFIRLGDT